MQEEQQQKQQEEQQRQQQEQEKQQGHEQQYTSKQDAQQGEVEVIAGISFADRSGNDPASATSHIHHPLSSGGDPPRPRAQPGHAPSDQSLAKQKVDIFDEWRRGNRPRSRQERIVQKLQTDDGVRQLHEDMRHESFRFKCDYLPNQSPENIYENRIHYSRYGLQVHKQAERQQALREGKWPPTSPSQQQSSPSNVPLTASSDLASTSRPKTAERKRKPRRSAHALAVAGLAEELYQSDRELALEVLEA